MHEFLYKIGTRVHVGVGDKLSMIYVYGSCTIWWNWR